ncbi:transcriptional regulator [Paracoccus yeei]|uniref:transcriptional regulator n=1 Tax=Paracoccus yeei TaxID=147645 RepID=UPI001CD2B100|nr:YdaS family helix-turn-helix protein [Paracoccus yeei]
MQNISPLIDRAIKIRGSQAKLAEAMGCSQQQVSYLRRAKRVSAEMAKALEAATNGLIPKHILRPDIFEAPSDTESARQ